MLHRQIYLNFIFDVKHDLEIQNTKRGKSKLQISEKALPRLRSNRFVPYVLICLIYLTNSFYSHLFSYLTCSLNEISKGVQ